MPATTHHDSDPVVARLNLFGEPLLDYRGVASHIGLPARAIVLLALLAFERRRPIARSHLAASLWPDISERAALANLRRYLHLIAHKSDALSNVIEQTKTHVRWNQRSPIVCDVIEFCQAAERGAATPNALALYRGELCAGIDDPCLQPVREELDATLARMLRDSVTAALSSDDRATAISSLRRLAAAEPYDEDLARRLISLYLETSDRAAALREYHALVERLHDDLGIAPEEATSDLLVSLVSGGTKRSAPNNITRPSDSFLGRRSELQAIDDALAKHRIVSIVGGAGLGKTRLALEAAHGLLERFPGGVWIVELARCATADAVYDRILETVDAPRTEDALGALARAFFRNDILVVLDNLEQLGALARDIVEALEQRTKATFLTTSRRRPLATGEHVLYLGPLEVPPAAPTAPEVLARFGSVKLFLERATKVAPAMRVDFDNARSLASIARRLDGVPLAIELVASRANLLTLHGIAKRLDDQLGFADRRRQERHVTIEAAVAWSYDLLAAVEKAVFHCIAAFGDSWTIEAFEYVASSFVRDDVMTIVSELVESSLITTEHRGGAIRYRAYETTRSLAGARLDEAGMRERCAQRHLEYYVGVAESVASDFASKDEQLALDRCDRERTNFDAALAWSVAHDVPRAARLVTALARYWVARGYTRMALRIVAEIEARGGIELLGVRDTARFAFAAGTIAREIDFPKAEAYLRRAANAFAACGDSSGENDVRYARGAVAITRGDFTVAAALFEECLDVYRATEDQRGMAGALTNLAQIDFVRGAFDTALDRLELARSGFERTGNARGIAHVFRSRAVVYAALHRYDDAIAQGREAVLLYERLSEPPRVAEALSALADACSDAGRFDEAFEAVARSFTILQDVPHDIFLLHAIDSLIVACRGIGAFEDVLRVYAIGAAHAQRIGRTDEGLEGFNAAVEGARAALAPAVADAALASGISLGIEYCLRLAQRGRRAVVATDVDRTQPALS